MSHPTFPTNASTFFGVGSDSRTRIFRLDSEPDFLSSAELSQVATINVDRETGVRIVDALNEATATGRRTELTRLTAGLPAPVIQSLDEALAACPAPELIALGFENEPMRRIRTVCFGEHDKELLLHLEAAMTLGVQAIVENELDEDERLSFNLTVLSDDREVDATGVDTWWPIPAGTQVVERLNPSPADLGDAMSDPRWGTHHARAYWLWIGRGDGAQAEWFVEFLDATLEPQRNFRVFIAGGDHYPFVTDRSRFVIWVALWNMASDLEACVQGWPDYDSQVKDDMPPLVQGESRVWWREVWRSAARLSEAARTGVPEQLVPRTPAEEALLSLATRNGYIDWARDSITSLELERQYNALAVHPDDDIFEEILGSLTGDVDIEAFWGQGADEIADPDNPINQAMGVADYRPIAWHRLFDRHVPEMPPPSPDESSGGRLG